MIYQRAKIAGFPGYEIDTNGVVYSLPRNGTCGGTLNPSKTNGYLHLVLHKNRKKYGVFIHRLIALAFIPNFDNKPQVCHKDGNRLNNEIGNLYWGTQKENMDDALRHGTFPGFQHKGKNFGVYGEKNGTAKLNEKQVRVIKHIAPIPGHINIRMIAKIFKVSPTIIGYIFSGKTWKHVII